MKSNMSINCDFLIGTNIKDCIQEAKEKARMFNVDLVCFEINGVIISVGQDSDIIEIIKYYHYQIRG